MNWSVPFPARDKAGGRWLPRFMVALERRWGAYCRWRIEQIAARQLHAMSDRDLKDIGLIRGEIGYAVNTVPLGAAGADSKHEPHPTKWRGVNRIVR